MIKFSILPVATFFLFSCGQNKQQEQQTNISDSTSIDTLAILNDPKNNLNVQTSSFSEIDSSGIIMFPLSMGEASRDDGIYFSKKSPFNGYWNIIFFNSNTSAYHLLSERKMLIGSYNMSFSNSSYSSSGSSYSNGGIVYTNRYIFYTVTVDDYNQDRKLDPDDPEYLFVSDKEGNNFRQVSPANYNVRSWQLIKASNKVIMAVTNDSDNNKEFGDKDEVCTFQIDIDKETQATEIFSAEFKKKLKILYDKDWKRVKK